jgi:hypothetical protein
MPAPMAGEFVVDVTIKVGNEERCGFDVTVKQGDSPVTIMQSLMDQSETANQLLSELNGHDFMWLMLSVNESISAVLNDINMQLDWSFWTTHTLVIDPNVAGPLPGLAIRITPDQVYMTDDLVLHHHEPQDPFQ